MSIRDITPERALAVLEALPEETYIGSAGIFKIDGAPHCAWGHILAAEGVTLNDHLFRSRLLTDEENMMYTNLYGRVYHINDTSLPFERRQRVIATLKRWLEDGE